MMRQPGDPDPRWFSFDPEARAGDFLVVVFSVSHVF